MSNAITYHESGFSQAEYQNYDFTAEISAHTILWLNIDSTESAEFEALIAFLNLHPLLVEDLRSSTQLPKYELYENVGFLSLQMIRKHSAGRPAIREHMGILVIDNMLFTVQDKIQGDVFEGVRQKLKINYKRLAKNGVDYLFLSLVDALVDEYMSVVDSFRNPIEELEQAMVKRPGVSVMKRIMEYKTELNRVRRFTVPLREELQRLKTENPEFIRKQNQALYRDIMDHLNTLISNFENLREMLRDLTDLHNSNQNLVLNNTMKTLTGISAVFIPLTFIVGVYGMNFKYFPELEWKDGYYIIWGIMIFIAIGMVWYMKRKRWF